MAYSKQTWKNKKAGGTPINADALNHMEDGIEAASYKVDVLDYDIENNLITITYDNEDKTTVNFTPEYNNDGVIVKITKNN